MDLAVQSVELFLDEEGLNAELETRDFLRLAAAAWRLQ
jgi:hypothetical protein